eukprot:TRINITY_DN4246_c0_g1_i3.p1 TRINITY_DN4246_c0_g1~~TRINITY_DN4246_c0_g1_i3.p1  ORF type:complete len:175 (+),score=24.42 TRINITY_DN4246_c0_g1_i3:40-564(+)
MADDLYAAVHSGNLQQVKSIFAEGKDVDGDGCPFGSSPLHVAVCSCTNQTYVSITNFLLENGTPVDIADEDGFTSLHLAAYTSSRCDAVSAAKILLDNGADIDKRNGNGMAPPCRRWVAVLTSPFHAQAGSTPLHILARECRGEHSVSLARLLLCCGADINLTDVSGMAHRVPR